MDPTMAQTLWAYNAWANGRILAAAATLPPAALQGPVDSGHGTLFDTLLHLLDAEYGWRMLVATGAETPVLTADDIPDLPALAARVQEEEVAMRAYLAGLSAEDLAGAAEHVIDGTPRAWVRWQVLVHVINHGTHHRGEIAAALTALGASPGELDFLNFLRQ